MFFFFFFFCFFFFFLQILPLFSCRGSTNWVASWYGALTDDTKAFIRATGFEPIIHLLPESHANAILVQSLAKKWRDTTHTFHIVNREMTVTPHDFHWVTGLRCDRAIISLEDELGVQLGIELLGRRYMMDRIHYFDIESYYKPLPWVMPRDYAWMVRAFQFYILGAYLFTNGGQIVSLRWLTLFHNFEDAWGANWG